MECRSIHYKSFTFLVITAILFKIVNKQFCTILKSTLGLCSFTFGGYCAYIYMIILLQYFLNVVKNENKRY